MEKEKNEIRLFIKDGIIEGAEAKGAGRDVLLTVVRCTSGYSDPVKYVKARGEEGFVPLNRVNVDWCEGPEMEAFTDSVDDFIWHCAGESSSGALDDAAKTYAQFVFKRGEGDLVTVTYPIELDNEVMIRDTLAALWNNICRMYFVSPGSIRDIILKATW